MSTKLVETLQKIENVVNQNPEPISANVVYQFNITGDEEGTFQLHLQDGQAKTIQGTDLEAACTLTMSYESFLKFLTGKLNGTMAFMTGKLKVQGDITKAMKLESTLKQYNFA